MSERQNYIIKLADQDVFQIGDKKYVYHKVSNEAFDKLEEMKLQIRKETDPDKGSALIRNIMITSANMFFGMTEEDYKKAPREELGYAIEAANYRSIYGKPFLSNNSMITSDSTAQSSPSAMKPAES